MNVHRLRTVDDFPPPSAVPLVESEPPAAPYKAPRFPYLRVLGVRRWTMFWTTLVLTLIAAFVILLMPSTYIASTSVQISAQRDLDAPGDRSATVAGEVAALMSAQFSERAIRKLGLDHDAELVGRQSASLLGMILTTLGLRERAIAPARNGQINPILIQRFASRLTVEPVANSTMVRIAFAGSSPTKAANLVNEVVGVYLANKTAAAPTPARADLAQLAERARYDEQALTQYRSALKSSSQSQQQAERTQQIADARSAVATEETKFRELNTLYHSGGVDAVVAKFPSAAFKKLQDHLADLRRQAAELSVKYGDRHPTMIALRADQTETSKKLDGAVQRLIQNQGGKLNAARAQLNSIEQSPGLAPSQADTSEDTQLSELEERARASRAAYQAALDAPVPSVAAPQVGARQLQPASPARAIASPNRPMLLGAAFGGSLLLSMLLAMWLERPKNAFRTGPELEGLLRIPNLAIVPIAQSRKGSAERVVRKPRSSFAEGIRAVFAGLQLMRGGQPKVVMVTSSVPGEGKTAIAVALGRLVARSGARVVLVDCDLRDPSVAQLFGAQRMESGLGDVLVGNCDLATILRRDPLSPLEFLPSAAPSERSADLIGSQALKNLIQVLRLHYDLVILDAAPVLPIADARLLSRLADKAIYVVEWNKTPTEAVQGGISMLRSAGADVGGTVLNKADMRRHAIYSYGFEAQSRQDDRGRYYAE
ncbi:MAG: polysaccharide biosynthesis tyrosine autokinase [Alphaproteobacteria bacterium]|nr:polysaccharide biosynthesis tyrosine autokinase [Alphaproteobacteria bacterium]